MQYEFTLLNRIPVAVSAAVAAPISPMHLMRRVGGASARSGSRTTSLLVFRVKFLVVIFIWYENGVPSLEPPPYGKLANEICDDHRAISLNSSRGCD